MLKAYFDDSCGDEGSRTMLLAGCIHRCKDWANFSISWEAALASQPSIRYLHMRELGSPSGEFAGWKVGDRDSKIRTLAGVIRDYEPWVIVAWLSRSEHDTLLKSVAPYAIRQAYFLLFYAAIVKLAHWHHAMGIKLPVDFVFDQQGTIGDQAAMWFSYMRSLENPEIRELLGGSPVFKDDKFVAPLQAADMVSWHMRRRKDYPSKLDSNWPTATLSELLRAEIHIPKEALQSAAEQMKKVPGLALVQGKPSKAFKTALEEVVRNLKL